MRRILVILLLCLPPPAAAHRLEFVYISANEGTASGGHAAIRFDDEVFHFQHVPPGLLRITRDDFGWFRTLYGLAENRPLFSHRIAVTDDTWSLLREGFNRRLLIEDEQFDQLESLERDRRLLRLHLVAHAGSPAMIELKGLGLFPEGGWHPGTLANAAGRGHTTLQTLREIIEQRRGADYLPGLSRSLQERIATLQPDGFIPDPAQIQADRFLPARHGYADRYGDALTALAALEVLRHGLSLRPGVLLCSHRPDFALNATELASLQAFRKHLEISLAELPEDHRSDWGLRLLVGMARLIAIDASLRTEHLTVLDLGADDTDPSPNVGPGTPHARFLERAYEEFRRSKEELGGNPDPDERTYGRLERCANLLLRAHDPPATARSGRLKPLPTRPGQVLAIAPRMSRRELRDRLARLERAENAYRDRLARLYPYELLGNNCASEIFRTLDRILGQQAVTAGTPPAYLRRESIRRLGGYVDSRLPNFIPFLAFRSVGNTWRVVETREFPSWRHSRLQEAYRRGNPLLVGLGESNVLSSRLYRWHKGDAAFLFFSEDRPWLAPLTGTLNAAVGLGQSLAGLLSFPWDRGHNLRQGAKGFLISLPELFFVSIRKGSYPEFLTSPASPEFQPDE